MPGEVLQGCTALDERRERDRGQRIELNPQRPNRRMVVLVDPILLSMRVQAMVPSLLKGKFRVGSFSVFRHDWTIRGPELQASCSLDSKRTRRYSARTNTVLR